ncbi:MAG: alpha/beta hydrolase [Desulfobacteraceae bacterium]|jgi:pimeloyl-ACP methyl ester carboxylesterase
MPFVDLEDGRLYYESTGQGHPLVLIHGAWASQQWWRWQIPALSRYYHVVSLDVRGHGQSSPLEGTYSVFGFARDLDAFLQKVGIDEVALVGWSMGGIVSIQYCLDHPSIVKALILIATRGHRNPKYKLRIILQYLQARLHLLTDLAAPRKYDKESQRFPSEKAGWLEREARNMLSPTAPKEVMDWVMADITQHPRENYFEVARSLWNWEAGEALKKITVPTLVMVGDKDRWTPPRFSRLLHAAIPDSRLYIVENAGHCLPLERPDLVNAEIVRFLKGSGY